MLNTFDLFSLEKHTPTGAPLSGQGQEDISDHTLAAILSSKVLNEYYGNDPEGQAEAFSEEDPLTIDIFKATKSACIQQAAKRNAHTLKGIRRKGYYAKSPETLARVMDMRTESETGKVRPDFLWPALQMFFDVSTDRMRAYGDRYHNFTAEEWEFAIEFGVILARPDQFVDPAVKTFAPVLDECIPFIWLCLLLKHAVNEVQFRNSILDRIEKAGDMARTITELNEQLEREQKKSADTAKSAESAKAAWDAERDRARRELLRVEHEKDAQLAKMARLANALQDEVSALTSRLQGGEAVPEDNCLEGQAAEPSSAEETQAEPLPERGVLFLGGHSNLIGKLKAVHPGWTYINTTDYAKKEVGQNIRLVFVWPNYLGHALMWRVYASLPEDIPTIFLSASNLQRLEREMREGYQKTLEKKAEE